MHWLTNRQVCEPGYPKPEPGCGWVGEDRNDLGTGNDVSLVDICSSGSEVKFGSDAKCTQWAILANCEHSDFSDDVDEFVHCTPTWHM